MITINFTGGAKKWFDLGQISIDKNDIDIHQLLTYLIKIKPKETVDIDSKNLLIAINGVDSSALNGYATKLEPNDVVNIIPIIHGGSQKRIRFKITNYNIELFEFKKNKTLFSCVRFGNIAWSTDSVFPIWKKMMDEKLMVMVNSDDPAYFGGYINKNLIEIQTALNLSIDDIKTLISNSFKSSFLKEEKKMEWISKI